MRLLPGKGGRAGAILLAAAALAPRATAGEFEGLPKGPGQEETYYACVACHSTAIIKQQRLSRRVWDEVLVWMVEEKGMPELDPDQRKLILDYLAEHFGANVPR